MPDKKEKRKRKSFENLWEKSDPPPPTHTHTLTHKQLNSHKESKNLNEVISPNMTPPKQQQQKNPKAEPS